MRVFDRAEIRNRSSAGAPASILADTISASTLRASDRRE